VNLERPVARWDDGTLAGIDTLDYDLDIVVARDRSWRWKDEDEFAYHLAHPDVYWCEDDQAVWDSGWRVVKLIEAGEFPFDGSWCDFVPDPAWPVPTELPAGWDRPRAW
jgi:protein associated with RNAse G/E